MNLSRSWPNAYDSTSAGPSSDSTSEHTGAVGAGASFALRSVGTFLLHVYTPLDTAVALPEEHEPPTPKRARWVIDIACDGVIHNPWIEGELMPAQAALMEVLGGWKRAYRGPRRAGSR